MDELCWHFGLLDPIGEVANMLDNLYMKSGDKISTYNVDFMHYVFQLGWENSVLCHCYYQGVTNFIQLVSPQLVDWFPHTKLCWKALNEGYLHMCGMYKSNNK